MALLGELSFDLVVLDLMLPGMDGIEALKKIRKDDPRLPVLILTAKSGVSDKVEGLRAGADDYLTKPFHLEEFLLRIKRMLDRYEWYKSADTQKIGKTELDFNTLEITRTDGATIRITPHEANLIQYLVSHQDRIVTRGELLKNVWGLDPEIETRTVDTFISRIRRYIEEDPSKPRHIISIRGKGYRFMA
jgi:DNA-binding response OmpR family regulator